MVTQPVGRVAAADAGAAIESGVGPGKACLGQSSDTTRSAILRSTMATTAMPPAVHTEIRARPLPFSFSNLAAVAMMRAQVAANGWPTASDEPTTLSLLRSILPSGLPRQIGRAHV